MRATSMIHSCLRCSYHYPLPNKVRVDSQADTTSAEGASHLMINFPVLTLRARFLPPFVQGALDPMKATLMLCQVRDRGLAA